MAENKAFKVAGIKNLITRNFKLPEDTFDLESLVDDNITMAKNWNTIKEKVKAILEPEIKYLYPSLL